MKKVDCHKSSGMASRYVCRVVWSEHRSDKQSERQVLIAGKNKTPKISGGVKSPVNEAASPGIWL